MQCPAVSQPRAFSDHGRCERFADVERSVAEFGGPSAGRLVGSCGRAGPRTTKRLAVPTNATDSASTAVPRRRLIGDVMAAVATLARDEPLAIYRVRALGTRTASDSDRRRTRTRPTGRSGKV